MGGGSAATDDERQSLLKNKCMVQESDTPAREDKTKCQRMKSWCSDFFKSTTGFKVKAWIAGLIVLISIIARTVFLILKYVYYHPKCDKSDSDDDELLDSLGNPPPHIVNDVIYNKLNLMISICLSLLHLPEYYFLFRGCFKYKNKHKTPPPTTPRTTDEDSKCGRITCKKCQMYMEYCLITLVLVIYMVNGEAVAVVAILNETEYLGECSRNGNLQLGIGGVHAYLTGFIHLLAFLTRCFMISKCIEVHSIFNTELKELGGDLGSLDIKVNSTTAYQVSQVHKTITDSYEKVASQVEPVLQIFSSWFFISLIMYTIGTIDDLTTLIRAWTKEDILFTSTDYTYAFIYVVYDLFSYAIAYFCGLKLNSYHDEYYNGLMARQTEKLKSITNNCHNEYDVYSEVTKMPLKKRLDCDLIPSLWGIKLPLDSAQYAIPILVPTISLIWGFTIKV